MNIVLRRHRLCVEMHNEVLKYTYVIMCVFYRQSIRCERFEETVVWK